MGMIWRIVDSIRLVDFYGQSLYTQLACRFWIKIRTYFFFFEIMHLFHPKIVSLITVTDFLSARSYVKLTLI